MKSKANCLGIRLLREPLALGSAASARPDVSPSVVMEWELHLETAPGEAWQLYYRALRGGAITEMGLVQTACCRTSASGTVCLLLPYTNGLYEYQLVEGHSKESTPWLELPRSQGSAQPC